MVERREDLGHAIVLNSSMVNGARLIGPAVAGMAIAAVGEGYCGQRNTSPENSLSGPSDCGAFSNYAVLVAYRRLRSFSS
jgi:hypothetical protein